MTTRFEFSEHHKFLESILKENFFDSEEIHEVVSFKEVEEISKLLSSERYPRFEEIEEQLICNRISNALKFFDNPVEDDDMTNSFSLSDDRKVAVKTPQFTVTVNYTKYMCTKYPIYDFVLNDTHVLDIDFQDDFICMEYEFVNQTHCFIINRVTKYFFDANFKYLSSISLNPDIKLLHFERLDWMNIEITYDKRTKFVLLNGAIVCKIDNKHVNVEYKFDYLHQNHHLIVNTSNFFLFDNRMVCISRHVRNYDVLESNRYGNCLFLKLYHDHRDRNFFEVIDLTKKCETEEEEIMRREKFSIYYSQEEDEKTTYEDIERLKKTYHEYIETLQSTTSLLVSRPRFCINSLNRDCIIFEEWEPNNPSICGDIIEYKKYAIYVPKYNRTCFFQMPIKPYKTKCWRLVTNNTREFFA